MKFDDITLIPSAFSEQDSRKDTFTGITLCSTPLSSPLIPSNMSAVFSVAQAQILARLGGVSTIHRFCSIEENVDLFQQSWYGAAMEHIVKPWVSVGINEGVEFDRAKALYAAGARVFLLEVANASSKGCVEQYRRLRETFKDIQLVVGTFATRKQVEAFIEHAGSKPDAILVGVGNGSACLSGRYVTGINIPIVNTIIDTVKAGIPTIVSGGIETPADMMKCLALGASAVMSGKLFAATYESGARGFYKGEDQYYKDDGLTPQFKYYHGSASKESYENTKKTAAWRAVEGEGMMLKTTGSTEEMYLNFQNCLRSTMTYCNSFNLKQFKQNVKWGLKQDVLIKDE